MTQPAGRAELRNAVSHCRGHFFSVAVFSIFVNLLMLTGLLFMLQIYDRVLTSRSQDTLGRHIGYLVKPITDYLTRAMRED